MDAVWLCETTQEPVAWRDCFLCACNEPSNCFLTPSLVSILGHMINDTELFLLEAALQSEGYRVVRVTDIVGCLRRGWFRIRYPALEPPSRLWARFRGLIYHQALADNGVGVIEKRLTWRNAHVAITGRIDAFNPLTSTLYEYKTLSHRGSLSLPLPHHLFQASIYALLLRKNGYDVRSIVFLYLTPTEVVKVKAEPPSSLDLMDLEKEVLRRASILLLPLAPQPDAEEWECRYCSYSTMCRQVK